MHLAIQFDHGKHEENEKFRLFREFRGRKEFEKRFLTPLISYFTSLTS